MEGLQVLIVFSCSALMVSAQSPGLGSCPDKIVPMPDFDFSRYLGVWYEAERSWTLLEVGSKCIRTNYTQTTDGKIHIQNEQLNRYTGVKRVLIGEMKPAGKAAEGKINIKYSIPLTLDATYNVLKTDYDTFSVIHYCRTLGPVNGQFVWIMTRERQPPGVVMQAAYGVLDEYDIPRSSFIKTDQEKCDIAPEVPNVVPLNPKPATNPDVRAPSKEILPPETSEDKSQVIQSDPNAPVKVSEEKKEENPAETIAEPAKEEANSKKD